MNKAIQDEFTDLPVSRQRKLQMRWKRDGYCITCGKPRVNATNCLYHAVYQMNYSAKRNGTKKRASTCLTQPNGFPEYNSRTGMSENR